MTQPHEVTSYVNSVHEKVRYFVGFLGFFRYLFQRKRCRAASKEAHHAMTLGYEMAGILDDRNPELAKNIRTATDSLWRSWKRMWKIEK